jgi:hypothetical protein
MKNFLMILMIVSSSFVPFVVFAQVNFVRDLFLGITGSDVLDLQKILNKDPETRIAESGVGSSGNETTYFGNLTKNAVERFQLKYADYVLKPIGLFAPTGYVGFYTRDYLNKNFVNDTEVVVNLKKQDLPTIKKITPENITSLKEEIKIVGENLTDDNEIIIDKDLPNSYKNLVPKDNEITITPNFLLFVKIKEQVDLIVDKNKKIPKKKLIDSFVQNIEGVVIKNDEFFMPLKFTIKNEFGSSDSYEIYIDLNAIFE